MIVLIGNYADKTGTPDIGVKCATLRLQSGSLTEYIEESRIPTSLLVVLMGQFCLLLLDRVVYLTRALELKVVLQVCVVIGMLAVPKATGYPNHSHALRRVNVIPGHEIFWPRNCYIE